MPRTVVAPLFLGLLVLAGGALAQGEHEHHDAAASDPHAGHAVQPAAQPMRAWYGQYAPTRESSGTSWQPEASPHEGLHARFGEWDTMTHGFANLIYDDQGGPRGDTKTFMTSMLMVMAQPRGRRSRARSAFAPCCRPTRRSARAAIRCSCRPARPRTARRRSSTASIRTTSSWSWPRSYSHRLSERSLRSSSTSGLPGEPALGPPAFMHRFSGEDNPEAPITHHWLDSTHITYRRGDARLCARRT